jgi:DNA invertase Pin-like site-specific DNA recombinase
MTTYRAYTRVSTTRQKEEGVSLDAQREKIAAYARERGGHVVWYEDVLSGARDDRPAYQRLLREMDEGDRVLVARLDRCGRNKVELFRFFEECKRRRVALISVTQPDLSNEFARDVMVLVAALERDQLAERVLPSMSARAAEGRWMGRTPRWYRIGPDGHLSPTEDAGDAQRAFDAFLQTRSVEATAVQFNADTGSMRQWLRNRAYLGEVTWRGITVTDAHPAIVRRETFDAVNAILDTRRRGERRESYGTALLTGFLFVQGTERRLYQHKDKRSEHRWYTTQALHGWLPRYSVDADLADAYAVEQLMTLSLTPEDQKIMERRLRDQMRSDPDKRLRNSLARKRTALITEQLSTDRMRARGEIDAARWQRMQQEQQHDLAAIDSQLASLTPLPDVAAASRLIALRVNLSTDIERAWEQRNIPALRALVEAFVARIEVEVEPTEGLIGRAASHWKKYPPRFSIVWGDAVLHQE